MAESANTLQKRELALGGVRCTEYAGAEVLCADPVVSVNMITYNHAPYIAQAIESVVNQKTDFPIELLLHDDASTDGTAEICMDYAQRYPHIIRLILQKENQHSQGTPISVSFQYPRARGEYIAWCEGDDYWCDAEKLQKQVNLLRAHPDCTLCFCRSSVLRDGELCEDPPHPKERKTFLEFLGTVGHQTACAMFRRDALDIEALRCVPGAYFVFFTVTEKGDVLFSNDLMSVYRVHTGGLWSGANEDQRYEMGVVNRRRHIAHFTRRGRRDATRILIRGYIHASLISFLQSLRRGHLIRSSRRLLDSFRYGLQMAHARFFPDVIWPRLKKRLKKRNP